MDIPQVISEDDASIGEMGQRYLATGKQVSLRLWEEKQGDESQPTERDYETVGYLISGSLQLDLHGERVTMRSGDSWLVPAGAIHSYRVLEAVIAIEATSPPAQFNDRDNPQEN